MKICVVIPSEAFRTSAGVRIRYDRFRDCIAVSDVTIETEPCETLFTSRTLDHDVYIFCKTFGVMALILARRMRAAGKAVGLDLFDDYFSQYADQRLAYFREWLRAIAPATQFALCSTQRMAEVARVYLPDLRVVAIEDPVIGYDPLLIASLLEAKLKRARTSRTLDVVWFGIGDNPYFPVGIDDLVTFEPTLAAIERAGWTVRLRIVTNNRPFLKGGGEALRAFGIPYHLVEWTEQVEREELMAATIAMLPVNGQAFSRAKSMNRAVTALSGGCQVLSLGYPLYDQLGAYLYRSADELIADLERGICRLGADSIVALTASLASIANPFDAATTFVAEARTAAETQRTTGWPPLCLLQGRVTNIGLHKAAAALGFSVSTIFTKPEWNFPVRFDLVEGELRMRVASSLIDRFAIFVTDRNTTLRIRDLEFYEVDLGRYGIRRLPINLPVHRSAYADLAVYADVMAFAEAGCRAALGTVDVLIADSSPLRRVHLTETSVA